MSPTIGGEICGERTGNDLACVVDHALVVGILAVREVHAHCTVSEKRIQNEIELEFVPMFMPASRSAASRSTEFVFGPVHRVDGQIALVTEAGQAIGVPMVAIMAVCSMSGASEPMEDRVRGGCKARRGIAPCAGTSSPQSHRTRWSGSTTSLCEIRYGSSCSS